MALSSGALGSEDIKQLLIEETFPQLVGLEKEFGSILKGVFKSGLTL